MTQSVQHGYDIINVSNFSLFVNGGVTVRRLSEVVMTKIINKPGRTEWLSILLRRSCPTVHCWPTGRIYFWQVIISSHVISICSWKRNGIVCYVILEKPTGTTEDWTGVTKLDMK